MALLSAPRRAAVSISASRLKKFVQAEINVFAQQEPSPVKLPHILKASTPLQVATLIQDNIPRHFATRIKHLERLDGWNNVPALVDTHKILCDSFSKLRVLEKLKEGDDLKYITEVVTDIRRRHKKVVPLLADAIAQLRSDDLISEKSANDWLDQFLLARISTEMLTLHFISMIEQQAESGDSSAVTGIVDRRCDPVEICRQAVESVKESAASSDPECEDLHFSVEGHNCTASRDKIEFSFLPRYLELMMQELLKNSADATVRYRGDDGRGLQAFPIEVTVGADLQQVMIKITDRAGGISKSDADKLWTYTWTKKCELSMRPATMASFDDPLEGLQQQRLGMGLPLCRLYAKYLGGSLQVMSVPGAGVDTYLRLRRIDPESLSDAEELGVSP